MQAKVALIFFLLLAFLSLAILAQVHDRPVWDPTLHGITAELKREFDWALEKGDFRKAEQIRHRVAQEIVNAFWSGVNVRELRPIMEEWNMDFKGRK